jgi:DNA-binding SARP family transcriptional activator
MEFRILGPLEALEEGRAVKLGASKQRALLALFLLHANETLSADRLIDELWGERPPPTAAKTVQVYVSRLRKALAGGEGNGSAGGVATREHGYELSLDPERFDAHRFERLLAEGRGALAAGRPERAAATLEEALSLWRGPPLADLAYERFAQREAARLDELRLDALEVLIDAKLALGAHAEVIGRLEALVAGHPYRERPRGQLMLALYRSGRQAEALAAYQDARRTLVDELGIEPGRSLRELERAILRQDPGLELLAAEEPAAAESAGRAPRSVFVGREGELAELAGGLDDALGGRGCLFLLVGEPGIGKSRLAEELVARARAGGARVLVGRCWEAGGAPAYWPWVQSLRDYVRDSDGAALREQLGAGAADLAQLLPELRERFPDLSEPPSPDSDAARFRLFDAVAEFLRRACQSRPIVLVLDDLHAADAPSLLLLRFLTRELGSTRMLVLGAYRDVDPLPGQPLTEMLADVTREPVTRRLSLGGLSERETLEYAELTSADLASAELVAALYEETEGNPLFVGEMLRLLAVEGVRSVSPAEVRLAIPQSVRDVIARRLTHLSEECNRVLVLASVLGREFALEGLSRMGGVSEEELLDLLDEAMTARVVSDVGGGAGRLRFAHVLIRDTLYDGLTSARRLRLHRLAVEALEALYGDEPGPHLAELAYHSVVGSDFDKGLLYGRRAGDRSLRLLAYEEAARLYESALDALGFADPQDEQTRCKLLLGLGEAEVRAGKTRAAKQAFVEAAGIARRLGLARELAQAAAGYGGRIAWARAARDDRLVPLLEEGLAALADEDVELRARLLARLAGALRDEPSRQRRDRLSGEAVELARRTGDPAALAYALDGRVAAIVGPDTVAECLALGTELRQVAERIGDKERVAAGHYARVFAQLQVGDLPATEAELKAMSGIADELRQPAQLWLACAVRAMLALAAGRLTEAGALVPQALALGERAVAEIAIPTYGLQQYTLYDFRGSLEEAEPAIRDLVVAYPARPVFRCALALLHARLGRTEQAKRGLDQLSQDRCSALPLDQEWLYGMSLLAETCVLLSDSHPAAVLSRLLTPWAGFNAVDIPEGTRGAVSRYLGLLSTTTKHWEEAEVHFENAVAMNSRMGARPWLAHTQSDYARMLLARDGPGDRERAQKLLDAALASYRELGMKSYAATAATLSRKVGTTA